MKIKIVSYSKSPPSQIALVSMVNGKIEVDTKSEMVREMVMEDSWSYNNKELSAKDGEAFLKVMPHIWSGSRFRAETVED